MLAGRSNLPKFLPQLRRVGRVGKRQVFAPVSSCAQVPPADQEPRARRIRRLTVSRAGRVRRTRGAAAPAQETKCNEKGN